MNMYKYLLFLMVQAHNIIQILQEKVILKNNLKHEIKVKKQVIVLNLPHTGLMEITK